MIFQNPNVNFYLFFVGDNRNKEQTSVSEPTTNVCYCGRKAKSRTVNFCTLDDEKKTHCPCVINQVSCSTKCKCLNCVSRMGKDNSNDKPCRCGESGKNKEGTHSCADIPGKRRTKCPCYVNKKPCTTKCSCHKCGNGKRESKTTITPEKRSAKC